MDLVPALDWDDETPCGDGGYAVSVQGLFLRLVLQGVSLRGVPRVLVLVAEACGWDLPIPHWTTGRLWLLRLGHALLTMALEKAEDWAWLIDHSVQIGKDKCLVILGIRLSKLPKRGACLRHTDMHLVALVPRASWTREEVDQELEAARKRTGVPRVIVDDHGVDIAGGVRFFQERHPETAEIYDAKHKAACLLKSRLEKNPQWQEFSQKTAQTRCAIQQTEMAFLVPPGPKPKARFMNLAPHLRWAKNVLAVLQEPSAEVRKHVRLERLQEKLGWLREYADAVAEWSEWQTLVNITVAFVDRQGLYRGVAKELRTELRGHQVHASSQRLAGELLVFVVRQARRTKPGERFPGSTEVLESCFGRFKQLEKQQARGGFTSLVLGFGALLAETATEAIKHAMQHSRTNAVLEWCRENLGTTLFAKRKLAFAASATKTG
jgi:hypothetical protein